MTTQWKSNVTNRSHNLPRQLTPFIGRRQEVAQILALLADPACYLLTLVGPGGIGKTRLALAALQQLVEQERNQTPQETNTAPNPSTPDPSTRHRLFPDGIFFINLQPVRSADLLASTICDTLGLPSVSREAPAVQLQRYLSDKDLLLLLDNFEHLLDGAEFLTQLLQHAPTITVLVTSREALNLQEERLLRVDGLSFPSRSAAGPGDDEEQGQHGNAAKEDDETYSALALFVERARRVRHDFDEQAEQAAIRQICCLVEGMPLAIELAATWTKTMSCTDIAAEIQRGTNFLATNLRNLPERHRSMQAVFEHAWRRLTERESQVFQRIAVFRGGFSRRAAEQVAGASLTTLSALVDKSLLRWEPDGRYQIHELLRQSAQQRLEQEPETAQACYGAHCRYFAQFAEQRYKTLLGPQQASFVPTMTAELENMRQAWRWAIDTIDDEAICQLVDPLQQYYDLRGRCLESAAVLTAAVEQLEPLAAEPKRAHALAFVLNLLGWTYVRIGQLGDARAAFERSRTLYETFDLLPPSTFAADPWIGLGCLANVTGDYRHAVELVEARRRRHETPDDQASLQVAYYVLANAEMALGQYELARQHAQRAYTLSQATGNRWFGAFVLNDLGTIARALGDYDQARHHYRESYTIKAAFEDAEGMAVALTHLAKVAWLESDYVQAESLYQQSLALYRGIDDQGGLATVLAGLGDTARGLGQIAVAQDYLRQALKLALGMHYWPLTLAIVVSIGELYWQTRQQSRGRELCALALRHPAGTQEIKARAHRALAGSADGPVTTEMTTAEREQEEPPLAAVAESLLTELAADQEPLPAPDLPKESGSTPEQPLVEPLTEREQEVLQLLADGLSNREIATQLVIALGTVKSYTGNIYGKLAVRSRTQAVARARTLNLLPT